MIDSESRGEWFNRLPSGVGKLDAILGGLAGVFLQPDCQRAGVWQDDVAHQFMLKDSRPGRPALYFTVLGEPTIKMIRYLA